MPLMCVAKAAGVPTAGDYLFQNLYLITPRFPSARDCAHVEEAMKQFCLGIIVAIGLTLPAQADDNLKGTYASVASVSCLQSSGGFDSKFDAIGPVISISSFTLEAVRTFNGDGTGTVEQKITDTATRSTDRSSFHQRRPASLRAISLTP
jgi:hypothetical protein